MAQFHVKIDTKMIRLTTEKELPYSSSSLEVLERSSSCWTFERQTGNVHELIAGTQQCGPDEQNPVTYIAADISSMTLLKDLER